MKRAIIVGASSGIGRSLAKKLVANGYLVGITGRRTNLLEELKAENPENFILSTFDICESNAISYYLDKLTTELGGLDLIVISSGTGDINNQLDFNTEKRTIDTNVSGFTAIADWSYNYFQNQKHGHLIAISSIGGLRGNSLAPSYSASKAYQINYLEGLRIKATKSKLPIYITDIRPGFVATEMAKGENLFWVIPVEKVSSQIYNAICNQRKVVYITKKWKIVATLLQLLPNRILDKF